MKKYLDEKQIEIDNIKFLAEQGVLNKKQLAEKLREAFGIKKTKVERLSYD